MLLMKVIMLSLKEQTTYYSFDYFRIAPKALKIFYD